MVREVRDKPVTLFKTITIMTTLTNKDKRQIDADTSDLMAKIRVESTEYARAYEKAFYESLIEKLQMEIAAKDYVEDYIKNK